MEFACPAAVPHGKCSRHFCFSCCPDAVVCVAAMAAAVLPTPRALPHRGPAHTAARSCAPDAREQVLGITADHSLQVLPPASPPILTCGPAQGHTRGAFAGGGLPAGRGLNQMTF